MKLSFKDILASEEIRTYIKQSDATLLSMGYTEHSFPHVMRVADYASKILLTLGYSQREAELASISGYLHDIGNMVNRHSHAQTGAMLAFTLLKEMNADPEDIATITTAIGNHDEGTAFPVNPITAALILADKADVRYTRVRNRDIATFDIHDRVMISAPEVVSRGFIYVRESEELVDKVREIATEALYKSLDNQRADRSQIKQRVKDEVSKYLYTQTKRKPMVLPIIMYV